MEVPLYCSKLGKLWCSCDQKKRIVVMLVLMLISVENPIVSSTRQIDEVLQFMYICKCILCRIDCITKSTR